MTRVYCSFFYLNVSGIVIFCNLFAHQALRYFKNSFNRFRFFHGPQDCVATQT